MSVLKSFMGNSKADLAKNITTVLLPLVILLIPCNETFTIQLKLFLASTIMAILTFAFENFPQTAMALILPIFWIIAGIAPAATVLAPWTQFVPWYTLGGLAMAVVLEDTGLLKRVSYFCISKTGGTYNGILVGIAILGCTVTIFIGDITIAMATFCYGLCKALDLGKSKESAGIMMVGAFSVLLPVLVTFRSPLLPLSFAMEVTGPIPLLGFFESFYVTWPLAVFIILSIASVMVLFRPTRPINGKAYFDEQLSAMGKMTVDEKKAAGIALFYLIFLMTGAFDGRISLEWGMAFIPLLLFFPVIGPGGTEQLKKLNFSLILFVTACMGIGTVAVYLGLGNMLVDIVMPVLSGTGYYTFFLIEWFGVFFANFAMTPMAIYAAFTVPLASIGQALGINPMAIYYFLMSAGDQIIFPYEYALYLIFFAFGTIKMSDFIKAAAVKTLINFVVVFALLLPWWNFIGFLHL